MFVIGCLLIDSRDTNRSMMLRFASTATASSFFFLLLSLRIERKPLGPGYSLYNNIKLYQLKVDVGMLNTVKNYGADCFEH